jgi:hydroxyacylglutathione hydrolase
MALEVEMLTVGPIGENCFLFRPEGGEGLLIVDPGEEAERILGAAGEMGGGVEAILLTHCHFDHVGAVAPVARATGAPVYCPQAEVPVLADIMAYVPWDGFGPFESYQADEVLRGGETLALAGIEVDVVFTPGHSPGHVTYAVRGEPAIFSGDVLFKGSVGRVDLPGSDGPTLLASIGRLLDDFPDETVVHPGHMGLTTLGAERATNPFLGSLSH